MPDIDPNTIIEAAPADDVVEADNFTHSTFGDMARHAQDVVQHSGIDFGPPPNLPPQVENAGAQIANPLHDLADRVSDMVHNAHDAVVEAAADDIHDAGTDTTADHADDHTSHTPDHVDDHVSDSTDS